MIYEFPKYQLIPYFATGLSVQNLSQKWNYGLPIVGGLNCKVEEGFFLNVQTSYRHAFAYQNSNWQQGVGILFKFGKTKSNKRVPKSVIADNTKPVTVEELNSIPPTEVFRADDVEAQNQLVIPESQASNASQKATDSLKINELAISKKGIPSNPNALEPFNDSRSNALKPFQKHSLNQNGLDSTEKKHLDVKRQTQSDFTFVDSVKKEAHTTKSLNINILQLNFVKQPILLGVLYFDFDQTKLNPAAIHTLDQLLKTLNQQPFEQLLLRGHTDARGSNDYNQKLGLQRAQKCQSYLRTHGIPLHQLQIESSGEQLPVGKNETLEGRNLNRRVEFWLIPKE